MRLLALDIGNTNIKAGLFQNHKLTEIHTFQNPADLKKIIGRKKMKHIAVSFVSPPVYESALYVLEKIIDFKPYVITTGSPFSFRIKYGSPKTLGIDRVCGLEGARQIAAFENILTPKRNCLLTVDLGTATTINILNKKNEFVGGMIAPGIGTMAASLNLSTAQLPEVKSESLSTYYGTNTRTSIYAGILYSTAALINTTFLNIKQESGCEPAVFITGGNAEKITTLLECGYTYIRELNLIGIDRLYANHIKSF